MLRFTKAYSDMAALYIFLALLIQNSLTENVSKDVTNQIESREILKTKPDVDETVGKDFQAAPKDWMDMFIGSNSNVYPTSSAALMAQATFSDKSPEEQLEDIKEMANQITMAIQSEMANLLSYAISCTDKDNIDNKLRKKRSVETPMDSSQLVMRLLKHIKSNNEYQNIAIEKMMSAQEIADKYGISFTPDAETLSDLAVAANEQAREMSEILKDACDLKNVTIESTDSESNKLSQKDEATDNNIDQNGMSVNKTSHDSSCIKVNEPSHNYEAIDDHQNFSQYNHYYTYPSESQIMPPPLQNAPVSQRPTFYDFISYDPTQDYLPYCSMEPLTTTYIIPIDEPVQVEPELVGEEYEETISSKVYIDHEEEPGLATVNHVTTYTLSEKAHFRTPQIESLPQQMQYYFFLM